jgi:hypothetical protein
VVLERKVGRPKLRRSDKVFLTALSRALPRQQRSPFVVTPGALLRWHRELVQREWTHKTRPVGRPPLDTKSCGPFEEVPCSEGICVIRAPIRSPHANAFAERFARTVRHGLLDLTLICGRGHLDRVLRRYAEHYHAQRPHRGLHLRTPAGVADREVVPDVPGVRRMDVLGGLTCEYEAVAA